MSARGPKRIEPRFYGRTLKIQVVRRPGFVLGVGAFLIALSFGCAWLIAERPEDGRTLMLLLSVPVMFVVGVLLVHGGWSMRSAPPFYMKLGLKKAILPRGAFAWTLAEHDVRLDELGPVTFIADGAGTAIRVMLPGGKPLRLPFQFFPPEHNPFDFGLLLQLRRELARSGTVDRVAQAGLEAQIFEVEGRALGVVVDTRGKRPTPIAVVHDLDDYEALLAEPTFPHAEHKLVVAADRVDEARDALEARILAAFDVDPEKVRAQRRTA